MTGALISRSRTHQSFLIPKDELDKATTSAGGGRSGQFATEDATTVVARFQGAPLPIDQERCDKYVGLDRHDKQIQTYHNNLSESKRLGFDRVVVQGTLGM